MEVYHDILKSFYSVGDSTEVPDEGILQLVCKTQETEGIVIVFFKSIYNMHVVSTLEAIAALFVGGNFVWVNFQVQYLKIKLKTIPLYAGSYNIVYNSMVISTQILANRFIFSILRISI